MKDINAVARSSQTRRLAKHSAADPAEGRAKPPLVVDRQSGSDGGIGLETDAVFDTRERELLKGFSQESLDGLAKVKKAFPASRVTAVLPPSPPKALTESERKYAAMEARLKEKCRIRGGLIAELDRIWPAVLKRRRWQRKEKAS